MSTLRTATVIPQGPPGEGGFGHRSDVNIRAMFRTPVGTTYSEEAVRNAAVAAFNGAGGPGDSIPNIGVSNGVINDGGHAFGSFDLNYTNAPDFSTVLVGGEGLPASPYVPNLASPGPGSTSPSDQPEYLGNIPEARAQYGSGMGSAVAPSTTAPGISSQKIGAYISGRSYRGSDGIY
jgi:hypothetical protein